MDIQYGGLIGLYAGLLFGIIGWYHSRKKNNAAHDEVRESVFRTARSVSWFATIGTIYILFTLLGIGFELRIAPTLGILMLVQIGTWGFSAAIISYYYAVDKTFNVNFLIGLALIIIPVLLFLMITLLTDNWVFLLFPIPISVVGWWFIKHGENREVGGF